jgi:hypothetical protein
MSRPSRRARLRRWASRALHPDPSRRSAAAGTRSGLAGASLGLLVLVAAGCAHLATPAPDIVWSGEVRVGGVFEVPAGRTLVIRPGTRVLFDFSDADGDGRGDAGVLVRGRIVAEGREDAPILFAPVAPGARIGWGEVRIEKGAEARFVSCRFTGAQWALHAHLTPLRVEGCVFEGNDGALRFRGGPVLVADSRFSGNGTAIRYWESGPLVRGCLFENNGTAVFCREGSKGSVLAGNDFLASTDYHVKLGEGQADDVDARGNWWGTARVDAIERLIYDREDADYLGRVVYRPFAEQPLPLSGAAGKGMP